MGGAKRQARTKQNRKTETEKLLEKEVAIAAGAAGRGVARPSPVSEPAEIALERVEAEKNHREELEYGPVLTHAVETFGSRERANAWLNEPHRLFNYKTPLQVLVTDAAAVDEELGRIDHGIYI